MDAPVISHKSTSSPRRNVTVTVARAIEKSKSVNLLFRLLFVLLLGTSYSVRQVEGYWCVARSDADTDALQTALDYACGIGGADCAPLQQQGLCFLPNTFQAHASYAFNSFYQRKNAAPGSCDFGGVATLAQTDPSYGSCVYPPNPSTAGGMTSPRSSNGVNGTPATTTSPYGTSPTISGSTNGLTPGGFGPRSDAIPTTSSGSASSKHFFHPAVAVVGVLVASAVHSLASF